MKHNETLEKGNEKIRAANKVIESKIEFWNLKLKEETDEEEIKSIKREIYFLRKKIRPELGIFTTRSLEPTEIGKHPLEKPNKYLDKKKG